MKYRNVFLNPIGYALMLPLLLGLGFSMRRDGGLAFSPGALSEKSISGVTLQDFRSHADFEKTCRYCHQPFKTRQAALCLACHADIAEQLNIQSGLHSRISEGERCAECHSDHRGRAFDPTQDALTRFDHSVTAFSLTRHQLDYDATPMECASCHDWERGYTVSEKVCSDCHALHDSSFMAEHIRDFGEGCLDCHDGADRMSNFDHGQTAYPLEGRHAEIPCAGCHEKGRFEETPQECRECHAEPDAHRGVFDSNCADCHSPQGWTPARLDGEPFAHAAQTGFSLVRHLHDYQQQPLTCQGCHLQELRTFEIETCVVCHTDHDANFVAKHRQQFGVACLECHDGVDRLSHFDHAQVFSLEGAHADLECAECHPNKVFRKTPLECSGCHPEPEIHIGFFGLQCQYCHTDIAWAPAELHLHPFPLNHGEGGESECLICHPTRYAEYSCYGCHDHQPELITQSHVSAGISLRDLPDCAKCHPTGLKDEIP